jgi:hypothetical protein
MSYLESATLRKESPVCSMRSLCYDFFLFPGILKVELGKLSNDNNINLHHCLIMVHSQKRRFSNSLHIYKFHKIRLQYYQMSGWYDVEVPLN